MSRSGETLHRIALLTLCLSPVACSNEPAPSAPATAQAGTPQIETGAGCTSAFAAPRAGVTVVMDGRTPSGTRDRYGYEYRVTSVDDGVARVQETMLVGDDRRPGPSSAATRRDGFVFLTEGPDRRYAYDGLADNALRSMTPGQQIAVPMVETSDFGVPAGKGEARGTLTVRFEGCSTLDVGGTGERVKVFQVRSAARAYDARAAGGPSDRTVEVPNRYWVSERLGLELRRDMDGSRMDAIRVGEAG